jgi:hypothetical protein
MIDFFANIRDLIIKLSGSFTDEVKTFSFIPSANATESMSSIIN